MAKKKKNKQVRADPPKQTSWLCSREAFDVLCCENYTRLSDNPEIIAAVNKICNLISSMTIHLMQNTENGDKRIKNELSKKIDIAPNRYTTRKTFISALVRELLLEGDGNAVVFPETKSGYIENLNLIPPGRFSFLPNGFGYQIMIDGITYDTDDMLHFVINPTPTYPWKGCGYGKQVETVCYCEGGFHE